MMLSGHLMVAAGGYLLFKAYPFDQTIDIQPSLFLEMLLVLTGCVLPDVDHTESTIGKRMRVFSIPISLIFGHRGVFHSLLACIAIGYAAYELNTWWLNYIAFGYFLHLIGDYLTPSGIPILYPYKKRYRFAIVAETNSLSELILAGLILVGGVYISLIG